MMKIIEKIPVVRDIAALRDEMNKQTEKLNENLRVNGHVLATLPKRTK